MARRLSEDQVAVVCRRTPAYADAEVAALTRTLRRYTWAPEPDEKETHEGEPEEPEEARRVDLATSEEGAWRLSALLPPGEGGVGGASHLGRCPAGHG